MITTEQIEHIVNEQIAGTDIFIVDINIRTGNNIIVRIDHPDGITIDTCVVISKSIDSQLDREQEDYSLEVTSSGVGQPFKVKKQYEKNIGKKIDMVLKDGQKLIANIVAVQEDGIIVIPSKIGHKNVKENNQLEIKWEEIKVASEHFSFK